MHDLNQQFPCFDHVQVSFWAAFLSLWGKLYKDSQQDQKSQPHFSGRNLYLSCRMSRQCLLVQWEWPLAMVSKQVEFSSPVYYHYFPTQITSLSRLKWLVIVIIQIKSDISIWRCPPYSCCKLRHSLNIDNHCQIIDWIVIEYYDGNSHILNFS